jgi:hypothetical protein
MKRVGTLTLGRSRSFVLELLRASVFDRAVEVDDLDSKIRMCLLVE